VTKETRTKLLAKKKTAEAKRVKTTGPAKRGDADKILRDSRKKRRRSSSSSSSESSSSSGSSSSDSSSSESSSDSGSSSESEVEEDRKGKKVAK
jgi:hypothetical protein